MYLKGQSHKILDLRFLLTFNEPVDYMAWAVMILMRGKYIMRAIGRVGLKGEPVLGPEIVLRGVK